MEQLEFLQCWLQAAITATENRDERFTEAMNSYDAHAENIITDHLGIPVARRINIYASGYIARLRECLAADFPVLKNFMGDEVFDRFANSSILHSPSHSFTLHDLGQRFINFLEATRPAKQQCTGIDEKLLDLPVEIAMVERAIAEVSRAKGTEQLTQTLFAPLEMLLLPRKFACTIPGTVQLLTSSYPIVPLFENQAYAQLHPLSPQPTFIAVSRAGYRVMVTELEQWQYHFLQACANGLSLTEAFDNTRLTSNEQQSLATTILWLEVAAAKQLVYISVAD